MQNAESDIAISQEVRPTKSKKHGKGKKKQLESNKGDQTEEKREDLEELREKEEMKPEKGKEKGEAKIKKKGNKYKHDKVVLSVTIHCMDRTEELPVLLSHPVVEVFICDADEGTLLKKSSKKRKVTSFYEDTNITDILPLMTQPFSIKEQKSLFCKWEEELIFNESLNYMREKESDIIFFFHLKDFATEKSNGTAKGSKTASKLGWKTFAWAFLKLSASTGQDNIGHRIRVQLYRPRKLRNVHFNDIYAWWKSGNRRKYSASLHVTLKGTILPENPDPSLRSVLPNQKETGKYISGSRTEMTPNIGSQMNISDSTVNAVKWERKANENCHIPNSITFRLSSLGQGCMVVRFSRDGLKLGCGTQQHVLIYDVISGNLAYCLRGHLGLIYSLDWSGEDVFLLSCSADATVRVWELRGGSEYCMDVLSHPSYVYTAVFSPGDSTCIVSGCYDHIIRVWMKKSGKYIITQELSLHLGYVTSITFDREGHFMYSGDKQGVLVCWKVNPVKKKKKGTVDHLELIEILKLNDVYGIPINHITFHPAGYRLLIHTRDSCIKLVNLRSQATTQKLQGFLNTKEMIKSCISSCGTWVLSGSEDSSISVWDSETGDLFSAMFELPFNSTVSCVDFHPFDNIIAVSSYSSESSVLLMKYDVSRANVNNVPKAVQPLPLSKVSKSPKPVEAVSDGELRKNSIRPDESRGAALWKDSSKQLLMKIDFILKAATEESGLLLKREKKKQKNNTVYALYAYKSSAADEASLTKGEIIKVIKETNSDWWEIERQNGQRGSVPSSYLSFRPIRELPISDENTVNLESTRQLNTTCIAGVLNEQRRVSLPLSERSHESIISARSRRRRIRSEDARKNAVY